MNEKKEFIESKLPKVVDETSGSSSTGTGNVPPPDTGGGGEGPEDQTKEALENHYDGR